MTASDPLRAPVDLSTTYLGMRLKHPFVVGASPLGGDIDSVKRLEDAGTAAIVLHSMFEEQITGAASGRIHGMSIGDDPQFAERLAAFPLPSEYPFAPDEYLEHVRRVKQAVHVPVIASLNGTTAESWLRYAYLLQEAGADALELNYYEVITDLAMPSIAVETEIATAVATLKNDLRIPIAVKLSPFFSAFGNMARRLDEAGADGLVLFNRFYQPDIDTRTMASRPTLELSRHSELLLRLRWLAILNGRIRPSLAATGGIETWDDGIKAILAGAHVVQTVSAVLRHGPSFLTTMVSKFTEWMEWHRLTSVGDVRGRVSLKTAAHPEDFERANYIRTLHQWGR